MYQILRKEGYTHSHAYAIINYAELGWDKLNKRNRRDLMRCRKGPAPVACPICGRVAPLQMFSKSGQYLDEDRDWNYRCMSCRELGAVDVAIESRRLNKRAVASSLLNQIVSERPDIDIVRILRALLS